MQAISRRAVVVTLAVLAAASLPAARAWQNAQPQQLPPFRAGVDVVQVDVSVLDKDRQPVRGLQPSDFTILEDGKPQAIVAFTPVDLSAPGLARDLPTSWVRDVAPDVVGNDVPREGRLVVILFDQSIRLVQEPIARRIASAAVEALAPGDLAAVLHTIGGTPQGFTADRARLRASIARTFMGASDVAPTLPGGEPPISQSFGTIEAARGQCPCGLCTLETITRIAQSLSDVPRRKTLLLIGTSAAIRSDIPNCPEIRHVREKMFRALDVANLTIQAADPTGLETLTITADAITPTRPDPRARVFQAEANLKRQGDLTSIAERTGGRAIILANEPETLMPQILGESSSYYSLGFVPAKPEPDGEFHQISVRVNRKDVDVHSRKGYYSGGGPPTPPQINFKGPPELTNAITPMWPKTALPVAITAAAFAAPDHTRPVVAIVMSTERDTSQTATSSASPDAKPVTSTLAAAFDRNGRSANFHWQALSILSRAATAGEFHYELLSELPLDPGPYELRTAICDGARPGCGSAYSHITVPDFEKAPLSLSGIVLEARPATLAAPENAFQNLLPIIPTARRVFQRSDDVSVFMRIYQAGSEEPIAASVSARIQDEDGHTSFERRSTSNAGASADYSLDLPIDQLETGAHLLTIEVAVRGRSDHRDVRFEVR